jgi:hypothetical protein
MTTKIGSQQHKHFFFIDYQIGKLVFSNAIKCAAHVLVIADHRRQLGRGSGKSRVETTQRKRIM